MAETRRRLRSSTVVLGGMGVLAAALSACGSDPDRRCVDRDSYDVAKGYKVVSESNCKPSSGSSGKSALTAGSAPRAARTDWYYDGDVRSGWADSGTFSRNEAVDRGGLGCSGDDDDDDGSGGG
ncbi:hypothetical protein [Streptomyces sp. NPDC003717]|uniref:hypothetical protein n=1 Tax=Streptomyces sp. NPDC003717 TaxID=3154276 RepID=UPI0033B98978